LRRGDLYRVRRPPGNDPKRARVVVVVSRQSVIRTTFSTVICAPVMSAGGLQTEVEVSMPKSALTDFVDALRVALGAEC
jgi:mRNA interferase MazF